MGVQRVFCGVGLRAMRRLARALRPPSTPICASPGPFPVCTTTPLCRAVLFTRRCGNKCYHTASWDRGGGHRDCNEGPMLVGLGMLRARDRHPPTRTQDECVSEPEWEPQPDSLNPKGDRNRPPSSTEAACNRREGVWGQGVWGPKVCVPKIAQIIFSFTKFHFPPL